MFKQHTKSINFRDFMKCQHEIKVPLEKKVYSSLVISPLALFDPVVLIAAVSFLAFVSLEKYLAKGSMIELANIVSSFLNIICPIAFYAAVIYLFLTNPFM